jgi:hypothetical protein
LLIPPHLSLSVCFQLDVLKGQLAMAKVSGDTDLAAELESNIALWEAIKNGGAIGEAVNTRTHITTNLSFLWKRYLSSLSLSLAHTLSHALYLNKRSPLKYIKIITFFQ